MAPTSEGYIADEIKVEITLKRRSHDIVSHVINIFHDIAIGLTISSSKMEAFYFLS